MSKLNLIKEAITLALIAISLLFLPDKVSAETPSSVIQITKGLSVEVFQNYIAVKTDKKTTPATDFITNPPRYILDLPGYNSPKPVSYHLIKHEIFSAIRTAPHKDFVRIVVDLISPPAQNPTLTVSQSLIQVTFKPEPVKREFAPAVAVESVLTLATPVTEVSTPFPEVLPTVTSVPEEQAPVAEKKAEEVKNIEKVDLRFSVSELIVNIPFTDKNIRDLTVKNTSDSQLFMTALAETVENAGMIDEKRTPAKSLLVSPRRFELDPGKERLVRLVVASRDPETEGVYRVNFIPDTEPFKEQKISLRPIYNAGLSVLVLASPKDPKSDLTDIWSEDKLTLENNGNTNIYLEQGKACKEKQCVGLPAKRIYSKASWIISAEGITSVEFLQKSGNGFENVVLKRKAE
jgi:hypothetical protein